MSRPYPASDLGVRKTLNPRDSNLPSGGVDQVQHVCMGINILRPDAEIALCVSKLFLAMA